MTEKIRTAAMLILIGMAAVFFSCHSSPDPRYDLRIIRHEQGWGYEIRRNHKPFICQEYIPVIEGKHAFPERKSARKTGRLVLSKLRQHQLPTVTKEELQEMGVIGE